MAAARPTFVAVRKDGGGARLAAVLNAMVLAEVFDGTFQFAWGPNERLEDSVTAALVPADQMFSALFSRAFRNDELLERFDSGEGTSPAQQAFATHLLTNEKIAQLLSGAPMEQDCWVADLADLGPVLGHRTAREHYARAFARIEFVPGIETAIGTARAEDVPANACALHLRGGDVITTIRFGNRFTPLAIPFPIAAEIGRRVRREGRMLFVFGQERDVVDYVAAETGGRAIHRMVDDHRFNALQTWFYETSLMARCERIVAGYSSFARVPSWIGGTKILNGYSSLPAADALAAVLNASAVQAAVPALNKAFAFWATQETYRDDLDLAARLECVDRALAHDPVNGFYRLARVTLLVEADQIDAACRALSELVSAETASQNWTPGCLRQVLSNLRGQTRDTARRYLAGIDDLARLDQPEALLCKALLAPDRESILDYGQRFLRIEGETPRAEYYRIVLRNTADRHG